MKKISLIAALALGGLIACSTLVSAQDAHKDAKKGKRGPNIEQLSTQLDLTAEQKPKVKELLDDTAKKMKAILTPEQWTKYQDSMHKKGKKAEKKSE